MSGSRATRAVSGAISILLAFLMAGCAGGSRSGTDQPGVPAPPAAAGQEVSINEASEDDIAATLRRNDVDDPQGWAEVVMAYRPYPAGGAGEERLRQILVEHAADPTEIDKITRALTA
jgi:hypothetical protein